MKSIGFIGLGVMGEPMASNLLRKGYEVTVYNRSKGKDELLIKQGATSAESPEAVARSVDCIVTMISNDQAIEEIYYGDNGVLSGLRSGAVVIDSSTISPELSRRLAADVEARGGGFLDAPVTGSKPAAIAGTLLFMVGGEKATLDRAEDILLAMGREVIHTGVSGSGSTAKLAHNTIVGINAAGLIEGMAIAAKSGIDAGSFLRIVTSGGAASKQAELKGNKIIERDYSVQFSLELMLKDLGLASVLGDKIGLSTPILTATRELFQLGQDAGHGAEDLAALARVYEEWIGMPIGRAPEKELPKPADPERRRQKRLPLDIPVMMSIYQWEGAGTFTGQSELGYLRDLSEEGVQIESDIRLEKDMFAVIHFLSNTELPPMTARIIRAERTGDTYQYGCMLSGLALYQRLQLKSYIESQSSRETA